MGDLSNNLSRSEFACKCDRPECNRTPVDHILVNIIQDSADHFLEQALLQDELDVERVAVHVNSGFRCIWYDARLKGKNPADFNNIKKSEHTWGGAADYWMEYVLKDGTRVKIEDDQIADYLEQKYVGRFGIGRYDGRTHVDSRPYAARWDNRGK